MSQFPPPGAPTPPANYSLSGARRSNGAAIASLICGILMCIPFVTGLLAVILGIVGLRKTRDPQVGGKGMSIAGIILGVLGLIGWTAFGGAIAAFIHGTGPQRDLAKQFLQDLSQQDVAAAQAKASSNLSPEAVQSLANKVKPWGALQDTTVVAIAAGAATGQRTQATVGGSATFSTGPHSFTMILVKENNQWKVDQVTFNN